MTFLEKKEIGSGRRWGMPAKKPNPKTEKPTMQRWSFISKVFKMQQEEGDFRKFPVLVHNGGQARTVTREDGSMGHDTWKTKDLCNHNNRKREIKNRVKNWNPKKNHTQRRKYIALQSETT